MTLMMISPLANSFSLQYFSLPGPAVPFDDSEID